MKSLHRRHPAVIGLVSTVIATLAALGAAATWSAMHDDEPKVDERIHITPSDQEPQPLVAGDPEGKAAPTDQFPRLGGGLGSLADYRGRPLVVNFFASWCVPCRTEMPGIEQVHQALGDRVAFVGLAVRNSDSEASGLVKRTGVTYDVGRDPSGKLLDEFGGVNMPSTFLVSASGKVVAARPGKVSASQLRKLIDEHLLGP